MPTDNPKVSGYVPQHIYDCFKGFYEERGISMSQAVTVILAEYFGLDLQVEYEKSTSRPLVERIGLLEQELASLKFLVENKLKDVNAPLVQVLDQPLVAQENSLLSEPLVIDEVGELLTDVHYVGSLELPAELLGEPPNLEGIQDSEELPNELPSEVKVDSLLRSLLGEPPNEIKPISGKKLSKLRFRMSESAIAGAKRSKSLNEFTQWTKDKDPDGIAWKYVESPSEGYIPAEELPSELRNKLLIWIEKNRLS